MLLAKSVVSTLVIPVFLIASVVSQDVGSITIPLNKKVTYKNRELYGAFIQLKNSSVLQVTFSDIDPSLYFILFQVHTQFKNITLYNPNQDNAMVNGRNVGLISIFKKSPNDPPVADNFVIVNPKENNTAFISVHGYMWTEPIPGGCDFEWTPPIFPSLKTRTMSSYITVEVGVPSTDADCTFPNGASYTFYMMYQSEMDFNADVYFAGIRKMMTLNYIEKYGIEIPRTKWMARRMLSAYPGTSVVFVVVARDVVNTSLYSVYVPGQSYGCPEVNEDGCLYSDDVVSELFCTLLLFVGLFMSFLGHRFFKTEMFLAGFFSGFMVTYFLVLIIDTSINTQALVIASVISGVFFGAIWLLFWWLYGIPILAVLLLALNTGFVLAAIFHYKLPVLLFLQNDFNYWLMFILIMVLSATAMAFVTYSASILCSAFLGGFCTMYAFDYYLGSNLKYIIVNIVRRAVVPDFKLAVLQPPFLGREILVTVIWIAVTTMGWIFQHWHNRGKPPFPPPPRSTRLEVPGPTMYGAVSDSTRRLIPQGVLPGDRQSIISEDRWSSPVLSRTTTERSPLLSGTNDQI